jgi:hypothetical protein
MSLSLLPTSTEAERLVYLFGCQSCLQAKELQLFEHRNMLGAYFYVSFATQKR